MTDRREHVMEAVIAECEGVWEKALEAGRREVAEQFRETLWQEVSAWGAPAARSQAVIGDGVRRVWEMGSHLFPYAVRILD